MKIGMEEYTIGPYLLYVPNLVEIGNGTGTGAPPPRTPKLKTVKIAGFGRFQERLSFNFPLISFLFFLLSFPSPSLPYHFPSSCPLTFSFHSLFLPFLCRFFSFLPFHFLTAIPFLFSSLPIPFSSFSPFHLCPFQQCRVGW